MMFVVLVQLGVCRVIFCLGLRKIIARHYCDCLTFAHTLSEFRPNATDNSSNKRHHWSLAVSISLDDAGCLLAGGFRRDTLAHRFDFDARSLSLFRSDCERGFSGRVTSLVSRLIWANTARRGHGPSATAARGEEPQKQRNGYDSYHSNDGNYRSLCSPA